MADRSRPLDLAVSPRHIVIHEIRGQFRKWGGTLTMSGDDLTKSSVCVWIDLDSVDTDDSERDVQIRSAEFFDVGRFPQALFTSTEVRLPERANPVVKGRLDLHGVTEDVEVEITRHNRWTTTKAPNGCRTRQGLGSIVGSSGCAGIKIWTSGESSWEIK